MSNLNLLPTPEMATAVRDLRTGQVPDRFGVIASRMLSTRASSLYSELIARLDADAATVAANVAAACLEEIPEYRLLGADVEAVSQHVGLHLQLFVECALTLRQPTTGRFAVCT